MRAKNEWGLGACFSHAVVFVFPTIWKPGAGYTAKNCGTEVQDLADLCGKLSTS